MTDILQIIPASATRSPNGWYSFNAPCCVYRGETIDTRKRGGVKIEGDDWVYHCFNCKFAAKFVMGQPISNNTRKLLSWFNVDEVSINRMNLDSIRNRKFSDIVHDRQVEELRNDFRSIHFIEHKLPRGSRPINLNDKKFIQYLDSRGLSTADYSFRITPQDVGRNKNRIIIPYLYDQKIVGWTSRFLDKHKLKYMNEHQQDGYLFGLDFQKDTWKYAIVSEGVLDAVSIKGLAVMHGEFSQRQITMLRHLEKEIIVVPDQDKPGLVLVKQAMAEGFSVSIPNWGKNKDNEWITDINEAVQRYGKLGTLLSIVHAKESSNILIKMTLNKMKTRLEIR